MANDLTPLGEGVQLALNMIEEQKQLLKSNGIPYTRPWMFVISDGEPTDETPVWQAATYAAQEAIKKQKCEIFLMSVDTSVGKLGELSTRPVACVTSAKFKDFFIWLSRSLSGVSKASIGENAPLPSTDPWASVGT